MRRLSFFNAIKKVFNSETSVFRNFASHFDMVYFGRVHQDDDDQQLVRGITVSNQHLDEHYCVGTVQGFDVILLKRTDKMILPNTTRTESYKWVLLQLDLHQTYDHPHVFIDGGHHNEAFYQNLFIKFSRLMKVDKALMLGEPRFSDKFTAYTPPDALDELPEIMRSGVGETMATHFAHLDFEWFQDRLIVYSTGKMPTKHLLEHMLRAGIWLAGVLDTHAKQKLAAHGGAASDLINESVED